MRGRNVCVELSLRRETVGERRMEGMERDGLALREKFKKKHKAMFKIDFN